MNFKDMKTYDKVALVAQGRYHWPVPCKLILHHRSENVTYFVSHQLTAQPLAVLRISRPGYHSKAELSGELCWMQHLKKEQVISLPAIISDRQGQMIQEIKMENTTYFCVVFSYIAGMSPDQVCNLPKSEQFYQIGLITARLHQDSRHLQRAAQFNRTSWDQEGLLGKNALFGDWRKVSTLSEAELVLLQKTVTMIQVQLLQMGQKKENFGLIHADLRYANLLVKAGRFSVIDFDDCGFGWYWYDLAASLSFMETDPDLNRCIDAWLRGYGSVYGCLPEGQEQIPTFLMIRRIQLMTWLYFHQDSDPFLRFGCGYQKDTINLAKRYLNLHVKLPLS